MKEQNKKPIVKPIVSQAVFAAMDRAEDAKSAAAVQPDAMYDYIEVCGIKFHRPTIAHTWVYMLIARQCPALLTDPVAIGYLLAHNQEDTRNKVLREVLNGTIREAAYKFVIEKNIDPVEFFETVQTLSDDLIKKKMETVTKTKAEKVEVTKVTPEKVTQPEGCHPSGGAV